MNAAQKRAWGIVIGMSLALVLATIAGVLHVLGFGWARLFLWAAAIQHGAGVVVWGALPPQDGSDVR